MLAQDSAPNKSNCSHLAASLKLFKVCHPTPPPRVTCSHTQIHYCSASLVQTQCKRPQTRETRPTPGGTTIPRRHAPSWMASPPQGGKPIPGTQAQLKKASPFQEDKLISGRQALSQEGKLTLRSQLASGCHVHFRKACLM